MKNSSELIAIAGGMFNRKSQNDGYIVAQDTLIRIKAATILTPERRDSTRIVILSQQSIGACLENITHKALKKVGSPNVPIEIIYNNDSIAQIVDAVSLAKKIGARTILWPDDVHRWNAQAINRRGLVPPEIKFNIIDAEKVVLDYWANRFNKLPRTKSPGLSYVKFNEASGQSFNLFAFISELKARSFLRADYNTDARFGRRYLQRYHSSEFYTWWRKQNLIRFPLFFVGLSPLNPLREVFIDWIHRQSVRRDITTSSEGYKFPISQIMGR